MGNKISIQPNGPPSLNDKKRLSSSKVANNSVSDRRGSYSKRNNRLEHIQVYQDKIIHVLTQITNSEKVSSQLKDDANSILNEFSQKATNSDSIDGIMMLANKEKVDHDTKDWIKQQMLGHRSEINLVKLKNDDKEVGEIRPSTSTGNHTCLKSLKDHEKIRLSDDLSSISYNIFDDHVLVKDKKLAIIGLTILNKLDLVKSTNLNEEALLNFLLKIQNGYLDNPYHSEIHAADVLQSSYSILFSTNLMSLFSNYEILAILISAMIHDYKHPGVNNKYLIENQSNLAIQYNDHAVLENHHLACAFAEIRNKKYNLFLHFNREMIKAVRSTMISLVLATDIAYHFDAVSSLTEAVENKILIESSSDKKLLMELLIKVADVSNPCKKPSIYKNWTERIMREFYSQGKSEKDNNLEISPFMDENKPSLIKCQLGFIDFIVRPLVEPFIDLLQINNYITTGLDEYERNLSHNKGIWMSVKEDDQSHLKYPSDLPYTFFLDNLVK